MEFFHRTVTTIFLMAKIAVLFKTFLCQGNTSVSNLLRLLWHHCCLYFFQVIALSEFKEFHLSPAILLPTLELKPSDQEKNNTEADNCLDITNLSSASGPDL